MLSRLVLISKINIVSQHLYIRFFSFSLSFFLSLATDMYKEKLFKFKSVL